MIKFDQMLSICKDSRHNNWVVLMALVLGRQRLGYNNDLILAQDDFCSRSYFDNVEASQHPRPGPVVSKMTTWKKVSLVVPRSGFDLVDITTSF